MIRLIIASAILLCVAAFFGLTNFRVTRRPLPGQLRVACVGDSITYGAVMPGSIWRNYPEHLQKMLGDSCCVENFGMNDRCVQPFANKPYRAEKVFAKSLRFEPDVVIIMLGTNDSKRMNWVSAKAFGDAYAGFVGEYMNLRSKPSIFLCTPPRAFSKRSRRPRAFDINGLSLHQIQVCVRAAASDMRLPLIDIYSLTDRRRDWFGMDGIHPNAKGASELARIACAAVSSARRARESA